MLAALLNDGEAPRLTRAQVLVAQQELREAKDAIQRRAQFVAHLRQELAAGAG